MKKRNKYLTTCTSPQQTARDGQQWVRIDSR